MEGCLRLTSTRLSLSLYARPTRVSGCLRPTCPRCRSRMSVPKGHFFTPQCSSLVRPSVLTRRAQTWAVSNGCHDSVSSIGGSQLAIDFLPSQSKECRVDSIINISFFRKFDSSQKSDRSYFLQVGGIRRRKIVFATRSHPETTNAAVCVFFLPAHTGCK